MGNQSQQLKNRLKNTFFWTHETSPNKTFCTSPKKTAKEIVDELNGIVPNSIRNPSDFYKVIHGERKKMYGWSRVDMVIRSEAEGGSFFSSDGKKEGPSERSETST